jgi:Interferon-induced 6-16 family
MAGNSHQAWMQQNKHWLMPTVIAGGALLGGLLGIFAVPAVLGVVGFGAAGVTAGSAAAALQSSIGSVAAGSLFAGAQSAAAGGLAAGTVAGITAASAAAGGAVAGAAVGAAMGHPDGQEAEGDAIAVANPDEQETGASTGAEAEKPKGE